MGRLVKCYGDCGIKHDKEQMLQIGGKNFCKVCHDKVLKEREERDKLYNYVAGIYGLKMVTPLMMKHIKEMKEGYGWSYKRIYALIKYSIEVEKRTLDLKYGLRYYADYYSAMVAYYKDYNRRQRANQGKVNEKRILVLKDEFYSENKYKNSKMIDLEGIE